MRATFPLFQSHLDLAHDYWRRILQPNDQVIDATCGNGNDTLKLCQLLLSNGTGKVYVFDNQSDAIDKTKALLREHLNLDQFKQIHFILGCHSKFSDYVLPNTIKLIVYNLGYLPGGDKKKTTLTSTTLLSLQNSLNLIKPGGMICITCYPGHAEGLLEEKTLLKFALNLSPMEWSCCYHSWINRRQSPSLLLLQKTCQQSLHYPNPTTVL
ncbi:putative rRNA methylase YtqB [Candidatus Protochlamydia amoebophila]|uniref:class I SAM-dependent methyltransferase n=1 Tax=Candidatus Protochlamydia amoebophila TaxID=362787 RepID=UPI001BD8887C|nr:class I SAM-dependent methyltransferase [Candidatus Protochlamydia amoebophila]MBS4163521.1 putative rRNA methylase YtqB [Candidatus Protochlamydia amoebophila]